MIGLPVEGLEVFLKGLDLIIFEVAGLAEFIIHDGLAFVLCADGLELLLHLTHDGVVLQEDELDLLSVMFVNCFELFLRRGILLKNSSHL
jgi:hypothetical protein